MNLIKLWLLNAVYSVILFYYIIKLCCLTKIYNILDDALAEIKECDCLPLSLDLMLLLEYVAKIARKIDKTQEIIQHGYATIDDNYNQIAHYKG